MSASRALVERWIPRRICFSEGPPFQLYNFCVGIYWHLESSMQALGEEAVNLPFEKHRLNRIA
jgi:hypothetical protein